MSGRVIAAGTLVLLAAMLIAPAVWPSAPWASAVRAASCAGASHDILLTAPNASPRTGTRTTLIAFTVTYRDTAGCPPTGVFVVVLGAGQATMTATRSAWATGVTFRAAMRLPIGSWAYRFDASSGSGGGVRNATVAGPGTIVISAPSPTPTPTPKPTATPRPTPTQTPRATASPTSSPTPTAAASATAGAG